MTRKKDFDWLESRPEWVKNVYRVKLEVEYRRVSGTPFQHLFDRIMRSIHGEDYSATATYGNEGDLGCDGILISRKMHFAAYGPQPYFKLPEARRKMRSDFDRLLECWNIPEQVKVWVFVVNYPGVHPSLLAEAQAIEERHDDLKVFVWSRFDLTQQLLAYARMDLLHAEFGAAELEAQRLAPLNFVPEDTALPSDEATLTYRRLRARITCEQDSFESLTDEWLNELAKNPLRWVVVHTQFLVGVMASAVMMDAFNIAHPPKKKLKLLSPLNREAWGPHFETAWGIPASIILEEDYPHTYSRPGEDLEKITEICMVQAGLTLGAIRLCSALTGIWENEVLEDSWSHITGIKIHLE
ncbi:hypothetical protein ACFXOY_12620 [Streptomyces niveus]|uniref:hypothetical protein n=1 Tax=Streptomyces niveus TaxID=193462 RepID=UPI003684EA32